MGGRAARHGAAPAVLGRNMLSMSGLSLYRNAVTFGLNLALAAMLPAGFYGPVRAKPVQLADGTILAPTSVESHRCWTPYVDRSTDNGVTWLRSNPFPAAAGAPGAWLTRVVVPATRLASRTCCQNRYDSSVLVVESQAPSITPFPSVPPVVAFSAPLTCVSA